MKRIIEIGWGQRGPLMARLSRSGIVYKYLSDGLLSSVIEFECTFMQWHELSTIYHIEEKNEKES